MLKCDFNKVALQFSFLTCSEYSQKTSLPSPIIFFVSKLITFLYRSSHRKCSVKNGVLTIFMGKHMQHRSFAVNIAKFLRTPILKNICKRLLHFVRKKSWSSLVLHHISNFLFERLLVGNQCFNHVETSHLTETANQLTGFYIKRCSVLSGLIWEKLNQNGRF